MHAVVQLFWQICLMRTGPEHVPTQSAFVLFVVLANILISAAAGLSGVYAGQPLAAIALPILHAAFLGAGAWLLLLSRGLSGRFTATFTALLGTDALITALAWPTILIVRPSEQPGLLELLLGLLHFGLFCWWIVIAGFVFARALDVARSQGVALAAFVVISSLLVNGTLFPPPRPDRDPELDVQRVGQRAAEKGAIAQDLAQHHARHSAHTPAEPT